MMNKDEKNEKIRKMVKKGAGISLCAVLVGGLAAGAFEGVNALTGWNHTNVSDIVEEAMPSVI